MTDAPHSGHSGHSGQPDPSSEPGQPGFGDEAAEMANETEVEAPATEQGASAPAEPDTVQPDTTGVDNWMEEGGPLEPQDVDDVEQSAAAPDEIAVAQAALADRTADLQRLQAEYANYRKRVERDRQLVAENATYSALTPIIEVLDTIDRAREHGELEGGLKAVAEQLERVVAGRGLVRFGEPGDAFDPTVHEALSHVGEDPEIEVTTCKVIAKAGYRIGDRVVRAAQVLVAEPAAG